MVRLDLSPTDLPLTPGCWHILVDVLVEGRGLRGGAQGSTCVYCRRAAESAELARGSYNVARAEFAYDRQHAIYYKTYNSDVPPTGDPFDDDSAAAFRKAFVTEEATWPELQHDGGLGFLLGAHVYHALGEGARARYCEKVLRRTVGVILERMHAGDGRLLSVLGVDAGRGPGRHSRQQDGFALKFLAQTFFHFRFGCGEDPAFARSVLAGARPMYDYQVREPLDPGCGASGCRVYDGRILAGIAWYCLAWHAEHGEWPSEAHKAIHCAVGFGRELLSHDDWYDAGCLVENECHIWCGNMNLLNGLLPVRRMLELGAGSPYVRPHIEFAVRRAFEFLTRTSGAVTGRPAFVPKLTSQWAAGNMFEICDEFLRQVGEDEGVRRLREHLVYHAGAGIVNCFHRNNTSGAVLMASPEYRALLPEPPLPWDLAGQGG